MSGPSLRPDGRSYGEAAAREIVLLQWAESNPVGDLWNADDARWATALARASSQGGQRDFQRERARFAAKRLGERDERLGAFTRKPLWSGSWPGRALLLGLILGVAVERLGGAQMNLLALPLWGVLALQLIGYLLFIAWRGRKLPFVGLWERWIRRRSSDGSERLAAVAALWLRLSRPLQLARAALLWHAALLGLSLGLVVGLYARGLQKEYVIGWESTFLEAAQVQRLADTVLAPATFFSGVAVPEVATLRHGAGQAPRAPAGEWLHLLAVSVLLVALPRVALAVSSGLRARRYARRLPLPAGIGPRDLRLALVDPERRLAGSLLGEPGERLTSPEGDRLLLTVLEARPEAPDTPWWRSAPPPSFDALVDAAALPEGSPGWPAQRRQLRALLLPAPLQPAWGRLVAAWEAQQAQREQQALQLMGETLAALTSLRIELPAGEDPAQAAPAALQRALQPPLDELARALHALYGSAPSAEPLQALDAHRQLRLPISQGRNALLGGVAGGAIAGLKADLASGGLTMGAGALTGALIGGLGAAGLTDWLNRRLDRKSASVSLDAAALPLLARAVLERWLGAIPLAVEPARLEAVIRAQHWSAPFDAPLRAAMLALVDEAGAAANPTNPASGTTAQT